MKRTYMAVVVIILLTLVVPMINYGCKASTPTTPAAAPAPAPVTPAPAPTPKATSTPAPTSKPTTPASTAAPAAPKPAGTLTVGLTDLYEENFLTSYSTGSIQVYNSLPYDYLVYYKHDTIELIPGLAERWETSVDGLTWTLYIRQGVQWHDGWGDVTAEDVAFTIGLLMREGSVTYGSADLRRAITKVEVADKYKVIVRMKTPLPQFLNFMSPTDPTFIVSKKYVESVGRQVAGQKPVGSGPYKLVEHKLGDHVTFEAYDTHWRVVPEYKTIIFRKVAEEETVRAMLMKGDMSLALVSAQKAKELASQPNLWIKEIPYGYATIMFFGFVSPQDKRSDPSLNGKEPWLDQRVRQAMNLAIDRKLLAEKFYMGYAKPSGFGFPWPGYTDIPQYSYDPAKAKQLLADAGYSGLQLEILTYRPTPGQELPEVAEAVAAMWEKAGIKATIRLMEWVAWRDTVKSGKLKNRVYIMKQTRKEDLSDKLPNYLIPNSEYPAFYDPQKRIEGWFKELAAMTSLVKKNQMLKDVVGPALRDMDFSIPLVYPSQLWGANKEVGDWPSPEGLHVNYMEYTRHAKPLNTFRLFTP